MKYTIILISAIFIIGCSKPVEESSSAPSFTHAWVMTGEMDSYMGIAIALTTNQYYYYWMYSDVVEGAQPEYL
jgi:hypothetical protein